MTTIFILLCQHRLWCWILVALSKLWLSSMSKNYHLGWVRCPGPPDWIIQVDHATEVKTASWEVPQKRLHGWTMPWPIGTDLWRLGAMNTAIWLNTPRTRELKNNILISFYIPSWRKGSRSGLKIRWPRGRLGSNPREGTFLYGW